MGQTRNRDSQVCDRVGCNDCCSVDICGGSRFVGADDDLIPPNSFFRAIAAQRMFGDPVPGLFRRVFGGLSCLTTWWQGAGELTLVSHLFDH